MKKRLPAAPHLALGLILAGCADRDITAAPANPPPAPPIAQVTVGPDNLAVAPGDTIRFFATSSIPAPTRIEWRSSDTTVARVDSSALVTARGRGTAGIKATVVWAGGQIAGVATLHVQ